jgi:hypothetical protein
MLNRPRQTATWYRYVLGAGAIIAVTAAGAAAMWSGWLPSRPLQWNDINGRLNLGESGTAVRGDRPVVVNRWPSAGPLGYQAKAEGFALGGGGNAATFAERFPRREDRGDRERGSARWGSSSKSHLAGTSGRSSFAGGMGGPGGGLGTGGGVAQVPRNGSSAEPKAHVASPSRPSSPARPGSRGNSPSPSPVPPNENTTTVGDLATNMPGTGTIDIGIGDPGSPIGGTGGGGSGLAATPEPASIMLIGTGFLAAAGLVRRRRK